MKISFEERPEYLTFKALVYSNLKGQYNNSKLGFAWHFVSPFIMALLFLIVFKSIRIDTGENYWLLLCSGIFPYLFLESALIGGGFCIINQATMIKKINIPKKSIVATHTIINYIPFAFSVIIIVILAVIFNQSLSPINLMIILMMMIIMPLFHYGITCIISTMVVFYRDIGYFLISISRLLFWMSPTIYTLNSLNGILRALLLFNPFTYFITVFQETLLYNDLISNYFVAISIIMTIFTIAIGTLVIKTYDLQIVEKL